MKENAMTMYREYGKCYSENGYQFFVCGNVKWDCILSIDIHEKTFLLYACDGNWAVRHTNLINLG